MSTTFQTVDLATKDGAKFLRRVIRDNRESFSSVSSGWRVFARACDDWNLEFCRTIEGNLGDPDRAVVVRTDTTVRLSGKHGQVRTFHDSQEVYVREPRRLYLGSTDCAALAQLLLDDSSARLAIVSSAGSTHSSKYGLSFHYFEAEIKRRGQHIGFAKLGGDTVCNGEVICSGAIDV